MPPSLRSPRGSTNSSPGSNAVEDQLTIHRFGKKQYCVLPAGVDPESDDAKSKHLLISSRKACEALVRERLALAEAQAAAQPQQNGQAPPLDPEAYADRV